MFKQRPLLVFIAFALGVTPCVYANDMELNEGAYGPMPVGGFKGHESVIRMMAEHIEVEFGKQYSKVDARFVFRSTKPDTPARQLVGFPDLSAATEKPSRRDPKGNKCFTGLHSRCAG